MSDDRIQAGMPTPPSGPDSRTQSDEQPTTAFKADPLFDGLPRYGGIAKVEHLFQCGDCQEFLRTTRTYRLPTVIFLWFFVYWRLDEVMKCPRCMRSHILLRLPLAVLLANLLSPIVVVWWALTYCRTFFSKPG